MDSTVESMEAAYDALLDAVAALIAEPVRTTEAIQDLKNRLDAFHASCDRADELVRAAADQVAGATCNAAAAVPSLPPPPGTGTTRIDALLRAVQDIAHHDHPPPLQDKDKAKAAAGDQHHN